MVLVLVLYLTALLIYSLTLSRRSRTEAGFYVSDRKLSVFTVSLSLAATTIGGSAVVVTWTLIDRHGAWGILPDVGGALGMVVLGLWLAGNVRKREVLTLPGLLSGRYPDHWVRILSIAIALAQLAWLALSFRTLQIITGMTNVELCCVALLTALYSYVGGQWSVSRTDIIQFVVLTLGFVLSLTGGMAGMPILNGLPGTELVFLTVLMICSHLVGPDVYVKILSAESVGTARRGAWIAGLLKAGMAVLILLAHGAGVRLDHLNLLLFLGIASAILSSVDSIFISATAVIQKDILRLPASPATPPLIGSVLLAFSLLLGLSGAGIVTILAAGYTIFLVALFYPTLSVLIRDHGSMTLSLVPPVAYLAVVWIWGPAVAFFISMTMGGGIYALSGRNRA